MSKRTGTRLSSGRVAAQQDDGRGHSRRSLDGDRHPVSESLCQVLWAFGFAGLGVLRREEIDPLFHRGEVGG
jgi:hypothetical protein